MQIEELKYPIGRFLSQSQYSQADVQANISRISSLPAKLKEVVEKLTTEQLETPYRDGGWTVKQVVHHLADSHMNGYIRHKLTVTEEEPTIKPYKEALWADLADVSHTSVNGSITLLDALHTRWATFLSHLTADTYSRTYIHPEHNRTFRLDESIDLYAWHGEHHLAHITQLIKRENW